MKWLMFLGCFWLLVCRPAFGQSAPTAQEGTGTTTEERVEGEAQAQTPKSVDERLDELDQKVKILERQGEIDKEQAGEKAKTAAQTQADKGGFSWKSGDGA